MFFEQHLEEPDCPTDGFGICDREALTCHEWGLLAQAWGVLLHKCARNDTSCRGNKLLVTQLVHFSRDPL